MDRYNDGLIKMQNIFGEEGVKALESFDNSFKDVGKYILEFVFSDLGSRNVLKDKYREMITIVALITQGNTQDQLRMHIISAIKVGLTQEEVVETIIQCIPHIGFPKVLNAISVANKVFEKELKVAEQ